MGLVEHRIMLDQGSQSFGRPENETAGGLKGVAEGSNDLALQNWRKIDQQIAAADQIHARQGRVPGDVVPGKDTALTDAAAHLVPGISAHEEAPQTVLGHIGYGALAVYA